MQVEQGKYGATKDVYFEIYEVDGVDLRTNWTPAAADCQISTDGGAFANSDNIAVVAPTGTGLYKVVLSVSEMTGKVAIIKLVDAATKVFLDRVIKVETYGNASAQHPFDLGTASVAQTGDSFGRIGANGAGLTNINLPNQTMNITGSLSGSVGSVAGNVVGSVGSVADPSNIATAVQQKDVSAFSNTDQAGGILKRLIDVVESDEFIDTTATPWQHVLNKKGTPAAELARKDLFDVSGNDITSVATVIGKKTEP